MQTERQDLTKLLRNNQSIQLAYVTHHGVIPELHIYIDKEANFDALLIPSQFDKHSTNYHDAPTFKTLICPEPTTPSDDCHQCCQNEPVKLGCQIQPAGANWVGTAGAPVSWIDDYGNRYWGILSNWHVMVTSSKKIGHPQHQPTRRYAPIAYLDTWTEVNPDKANHYDAAIADAEHDDFHTIDRAILDLGRLDPVPLNATQGLPVLKTGRTTGQTQGICSAVEASVRVSYGSFTALFEDQDVFSDVGGHFSAAGDSGSLICCERLHKPTALLFAGGGNLTIGNPVRYIIDAFKLSFNLD